MTAPAVTAPAAPPQATQDTSGQFMDDVLASITSDAIKQSMGPDAAVEAPAVEAAPETKAAEPITRDDGAVFNTSAGRWVKDGKFVAGEAPEMPEAPAAPADAEAAPTETKLPEGFVAPKKIERELATQFSVLDESGELEVPDITIKFNAAGKERVEPLDKVVKLAQWGYANQEREQKVEQTRVYADTVQRQNEQLTATLRQREQERERLLSDPDYLIQTLTQFEQQNTPQARLDRVEKERAEERQQREFQDMTTHGTNFFNGEVVPAVETIAKTLPLVSEEEIGAKMLLISERFKVQTPVGSIVPPQQYALVRQAILNELVPWAQQVQDTRESDRRAETQQLEQKRQQAEAQTRTAQTDAQRKTNLVARVIKSGTKAGSAPTGTGARETPTPRPIKTVDDAERSALEDTLAAMRR